MAGMVQEAADWTEEILVSFVEVNALELVDMSASHAFVDAVSCRSFVESLLHRR
jgi:hypothetical protein